MRLLCTMGRRRAALAAMIAAMGLLIGPACGQAGYYKVGQPYQINGKWYYPKEEPGYDRTGVASFYGGYFHGRKTANGETYDQWALTAAHPTLPIPSYAKVTSLANGRQVLVRINDRGPYVGGRIIDLSVRVAKLLGFHDQGLGRVRVEYVGRAPLDGNDHKERAFLVAQQSGGKAKSDKPQVQVAAAASAPKAIASKSAAKPTQDTPVKLAEAASGEAKPSAVPAKATPAPQIVASASVPPLRAVDAPATAVQPSRPAAARKQPLAAAPVATGVPLALGAPAPASGIARVQRLEADALAMVEQTWRAALRR